jgi:trk system potassium uptake protein
MKVIVIGCGRLGTNLAYRLYKQGYEVTVVDNVATAFNNLPDDFEGRTVEGEALGQDVLHRAGIERADAIAAVTNSDALNAVVAHLARTIFGTKIAVVRNYDPHSIPMMEVFGLQMVSSTVWGAQRLEELIYHSDVHTVFSAGNGEVEIYEVPIPQAWSGRKIIDLTFGNECIPVSLTRTGRAMMPDPTTSLQVDDLLHVSATLDGIQALRKHLDKAKAKEA